MRDNFLYRHFTSWTLALGATACTIQGPGGAETGTETETTDPTTTTTTTTTTATEPTTATGETTTTTEGATEPTGDPDTTTTGEPSEPPGEEAGSDKPRDPDPDASADELATMAADERSFALELFKALPPSADNRAISPLSLRIAFGMLYEGARTVSEQEVADVLHFSLAKPRLHTAFNRIDLDLETRNLPASGEVEGDDSVRLSLVNQVFGRIGIEWSAPFLDALAIHYGSGMRLLDFAADPEGARVAINGWVADQTFTKIDELLPPASIFPDVTAVLVNALYLKAPWDHPFENVDENGVFHDKNGVELTAPMMYGVFESTSYFKGTGVEAAELPLRGGELSLVYILPDAGTFDAYVEGLDGVKLGEVLGGLAPTNLEVRVPRFEFANAFALREVLIALGMEKTFQLGAADLSGMTEQTQMAIADVYHNTVVAVDEKGVEAAAATAIVTFDSSGGIFAETAFTADRPFLFAIRDRGTDSLLWFGRVLTPG
ncbi:serpin family protein [Nannocystis sp. ILAH1]|uniref:serpin family protein n=1 Tax=Nannocystis sp. ILAH1 TaxID=2996789 RepID=UPI00226DA6F2|nr:serpin family protein [Nannocystis sp. ILAH1]MCY0987251.1 serpin family protein [Nannocystis sp. ILAH1]